MVEHDVLRSMLGFESQTKISTTSAIPTIASPSWWGADSSRYIVRSGDETGDTHFVKVMEAHTKAYVNWGVAFESARLAGDAGIGPTVLAEDSTTGVMIMSDLSAVTSTATVDLFDDEAIEPLVALRKSVSTFPALGRTRAVFDELRELHQLAAAAGGVLPVDIEWIMRKLEAPEQRIRAAGYDLVPAHGDGNVSNVLVSNEGGGLRLVDWDSAGMMDPLQDLGVLLQELRPSDADARPVFEMHWGQWDSSLFDRCRIYGIADCVRWGLIGTYADAMNPRTYEYSKFADWQFLRARVGLNSAQYVNRVRNL